MKTVLLYVLVFLVAALVSMALFGCHNAAPQTAVHQVQANAKLAAAHANANPVAHPFRETTESVKAIRTPLLGAVVVGVLALAVSIGLLFTPFSAISKIAVPVSGSVAAVSMAGVIALPFFPWVVSGIVLLIAGLAGYEVVRHHSISGGIKALEASVLPSLSSTVAA